MQSTKVANASQVRSGNRLLVNTHGTKRRGSHLRLFDHQHYPLAPGLRQGPYAVLECATNRCEGGIAVTSAYHNVKSTHQPPKQKMASAPAPASRRIRETRNYSVDGKVDSYWRVFRKRRLVTNNYFAYHRAGRTVALAGLAPWDKVNEQPSLRLVDEGTKHLPQNWDEIYADLDIPALQALQRRNRLRVGREKGPPSLQQQAINRQCITHLYSRFTSMGSS